ncbi:MAG: T9SS type A sorting domain-containing protein [Calditrichia bacterium]
MPILGGSIPQFDRREPAVVERWRRSFSRRIMFTSANGTGRRFQTIFWQRFLRLRHLENREGDPTPQPNWFRRTPEILPNGMDARRLRVLCSVCQFAECVFEHFHYRFSDGQVTQLTNFTDVYATDPTVSPDGQWIAFTKEIPGDTVKLEIWVQKMDGSEAWRLATDAAFPAWGPAITTGMGETAPVGLPEKFALEQNYPNPFNPSTTIAFSLAENTDVSLKIYNALGQVVRTLACSEHTARRLFFVKMGRSETIAGNRLAQAFVIPCKAASSASAGKCCW